MSARAQWGVLAAITVVSAVTLSAVSASAAPVSGGSGGTDRPGNGLLKTLSAGVRELSGPPAETAFPAAALAFGRSIKPASVRRHLERFQAIAEAGNGTRSAATPGYEASATYVADRLRAAGYRVTRQEFTIPFFQEKAIPALKRKSPIAKAYIPGIDFRTMTYSGSGNVTAPVRGVDLVLPPSPTVSSSSGCEVSDFSGFTPGDIALLQRGTCSFQVKAERAQKAGASAVILFNEGQPGEGPENRQGLLVGSVNSSGITIPVVGATFAVGRELSAPGTTATLTVDAESDRDRKTSNIIAESLKGDPDRVVMLGAHLDSVPAGPGINDNGSGSAGILETALAAKSLATKNRLRFAFWGAEELGLLGSTHYVSRLSPEEKSKIKLYLNFDMIASPNHIYGIYDGDNSSGGTDRNPPPGSGQIEKLFESYFDALGEPHQETDFTGRSDYGPFIAAGIPAGGLFTGAEGIKAVDEAAKFGGTAGVSYDPCYHKACDTIANVDERVLEVNSGAIGAVAFVYAYADDLPGRPGVPRAPGAPRKKGEGGGGLDHGHEHTGVTR